nr:MAG TPA: hypothetical protein [Caudoviricetes sp.]
MFALPSREDTSSRRCDMTDTIAEIIIAALLLYLYGRIRA